MIERDDWDDDEPDEYDDDDDDEDWDDSTYVPPEFYAAEELETDDIEFGADAEFDMRHCATCRRCTAHVIIGYHEGVMELRCTQCFTGIRAVRE